MYAEQSSHKPTSQLARGLKTTSFHSITLSLHTHTHTTLQVVDGFDEHMLTGGVGEGDNLEAWVHFGDLPQPLTARATRCNRVQRLCGDVLGATSAMSMRGCPTTPSLRSPTASTTTTAATNGALLCGTRQAYRWHQVMHA